jgi:hypothetical protein
MTLHNLPELFALMPDLYDYLGASYGAIESSGDVIINAILDSANNADDNAIKKYGEERCTDFLDNYFACSYYKNYLPGYMPIAFIIDDWYPLQ